MHAPNAPSAPSPAGIPVPSLEGALLRRTSTQFGEDELEPGLRTSRCICCGEGKVQTQRTVALRPGAHRWPLLEAVLLLLTVALLFGGLLEVYGLRAQATEHLEWSGWILATLLAGGVAAASVLRVLHAVLTPALRLRVGVCAVCAYQARGDGRTRMGLELLVSAVASTAFGIGLAGFHVQQCTSFADPICAPWPMWALFVGNGAFLALAATWGLRLAVGLMNGAEEPVLLRRGAGSVWLGLPWRWARTLREDRARVRSNAAFWASM